MRTAHLKNHSSSHSNAAPRPVLSNAKSCDGIVQTGFPAGARVILVRSQLLVDVHEAHTTADASVGCGRRCAEFAFVRRYVHRSCITYAKTVVYTAEVCQHMGIDRPEPGTGYVDFYFTFGPHLTFC